MGSYSGICQRLPGLYRPEEDDRGLLARFIRAASALLDETDRESSQVMQSHWFRYADDPRFDLYLSLFERAAFPNGIPEDEQKKAQEQFDIICDLARISSMFRIHPWQAAGGEAETVLQFRRRVSEIINVYKHGLGTRQAVENMTHALLPAEGRPYFRLEEFVLSARHTEAATPVGIPSDRVGPLMRWKIANRGLLPSVPTIYIEGLKPGKNQEAAKRPEIELFSKETKDAGRVAVACETDLPPGKTLCISPVYNSWIAMSHGLLHAATDVDAPLPDTSAPGPWELLSHVPGGRVLHLLQARDMTLWAVTGTELHSFDGTTWTKRAEGLKDVYALAEQGDKLLVCGAEGVMKIDMYPQISVHPSPETGAPGPAPETVAPDPAASAVFHVTRLASGEWWAGCADGVRKWDGGSFSKLDMLSGIDNALNVRHIAQDSSGTVIMGTDMGVLLFQPAFKHLYILTGGQASDTAPDWTLLRPGAPLPEDDEIFMPGVNAVLRGRDAALWFGTGHGIACYRATPVRGLSYRTHLTAFPELGAGSVRTIREDQAGVLWFSCENGLFRFDGVQWQRLEEKKLTLVPGMESRMDDARPWRFHRARSEWQVYDFNHSAWLTVPDADAPAHSVNAYDIIWTTGAVAAIGKWNGEVFAKDSGNDHLTLRMRYKPAASGERQIVDGGIPGIPALPPGESTWRYLRLEDEHEKTSSNRPTWTGEGRLIPPPTDAGEAVTGRFSSAPLPLSDFDDSVFAFRPCARVWFQWQARDPLTMQVRLKADNMEPEVLDRLWQGIQQVRPAGARVELVLNSRIARGESNG